MAEDKMYKELRRRAYLSYHQDGLIDIILGLCILGFGLNLILVSKSGDYGVLAWIWFVLYMPLKNRITFPRLGYVRFDSRRGGARRWTLAALLGVWSFALLMGVLVFMNTEQVPAVIKSIFGRGPIPVLGIIVSMTLAGIAALTGVKRLYTYAGLGVFLFLGGALLNVSPAVYTLLFGACILLTGLAMLVRFVRKYPAEQGTVPHVAK